MRIRELTRIGIVVVAGATLGVSVVAQVRDMSLETHIQELTGPSAADCGTHSRAAVIQDFMRKSLACARRAVDHGRPFRIIQRDPSSEVAIGLIGERDGTVVWFDYNGAPCGGLGCAERFVLRPCVLSNVAVVLDEVGQYEFSCSPVSRTNVARQ
jgi:hypothetical protein